MTINDDDYTEPNDMGENGGGDIKALRDAAARGRKAQERAEKLERENAFLKAGVNPDDPKLGYFYRGYDGDLSADAIRAAAVEAGFIDPPQADPVVQEHAQGQRAVEQASAGLEGLYDPAGAVHSLEKAFAEGGVEAMVQAGKQFGLRTVTQ